MGSLKLMHDPTYELVDENRPPRVARDHASLLFTWGDAMQALALREGQSVVLGRADPATFVIDERSLSRTHARITLRDGTVTLEDLESTNGSAVNGMTVRQAILNEGDVAQLGIVELRVAARAGAPVRTDEGLSHADFTRQLADELQRARLFGRALSVVALRSAERDGARTAIHLALRPVDRACWFAHDLCLILVIESDTEASSAWIEELRRRSKRLWRAGAASYPAIACGAEELVSRALDALHTAEPGTTVHAVPTHLERSDGPIVVSPAMQRLYDLAARAARTAMPVLVLGETGTGKELVARAVHERSTRAREPFKALNCATIPANLIESILFGHERGAFTGADKQAHGIFEQAQGGTVFLDEVGELSAHAQAALLRVLEQQRIVRVGGRSEIEVHARVIAATHRNLSAMAAAGSFREDLMFRLDVLSLRLPPLRERREEIVPLAELFLARAHSRWGASAARLSEDAVDALLAYDWPGNVRQLKNVVERAVAVCTSDTIDLKELPEQLWAEAQSSDLATQRAGRGPHQGFLSLPDRVRDFESGLIRRALSEAHGNQAQAARILGVPRRTLANKVHAYRLLE